MTIIERPNQQQLPETQATPAASPTMLDKPAFLMNLPLSYETAVANNAWMEELPEEERRVNSRQALRQFFDLYHFLASEGAVYLLPTPRGARLQDLVFTANLGVVLEHVPGRHPVVISNYTTEVRRGESEIGRGFFEAMGYEVHLSPHRFEGEAELKHLHDNVYIGGHGIRSELETYRWMERTFDMRILTIEERDPYLYHLDTMVFPITREQTMVCTELCEAAELDALEKHTNIIDVSSEHCLSGITNSARLYNTILNSSSIHDLKVGTEEYREELSKNRRLEDIAVELGFEVSYFNLSEYMKGGALLSCMVMHLNRRSYDIRLL